jgi:hypothetical protein
LLLFILSTGVVVVVEVVVVLVEVEVVVVDVEVVVVVDVKVVVVESEDEIAVNNVIFTTVEVPTREEFPEPVVGDAPGDVNALELLVVAAGVVSVLEAVPLCSTF